MPGINKLMWMTALCRHTSSHSSSYNTDANTSLEMKAPSPKESIQISLKNAQEESQDSLSTLARETLRLVRKVYRLKLWILRWTPPPRDKGEIKTITMTNRTSIDFLPLAWQRETREGRNRWGITFRGRSPCGHGGENRRRYIQHPQWVGHHIYTN